MSQLKARQFPELKESWPNIEAAANFLREHVPVGSKLTAIFRGSTEHNLAVSLLLPLGEDVLRLDNAVAYVLDLSISRRYNAMLIPNFGTSPGMALVQQLALRLYGDALALRVDVIP